MEKPALSRPTHFVCVVWGDWHIDTFVRLCVPSLLAASNLPAYARRHPSRMTVFSVPEDRQRLHDHPTMARLRGVLDVTIDASGQIDPKDPIGSHIRVWAAARTDAIAADAYVVLVIPDLLWADGSLAALASRVAEGRKAVYAAFFRAVVETLSAEVAAGPNGVIALPPRALVAAGLRHIHPLTAVYDRDSACFPVHPQFAMWPVPGEGMLSRYFVGELLAYDPAAVEIQSNSLLGHFADESDLHFVTDSDEMMALSLAPLRKDVDWYLLPSRFDALDVGHWLLDFDSPANSFCARWKIRFHVGDVRPAVWRQAELSSDRCVAAVMRAREATRLMRALPQFGCTAGAKYLAHALAAARLHAALPLGREAVCFVPSDDAFKALDPGFRDGLSDARILRRACLAHVAAGAVPEGRGGRLRMGDGVERTVRRERRALHIDDARVLRGPFRVGAATVYVIDKFLFSGA